MNTDLPVYIEGRPVEGAAAPVYAVRPLFFATPERQGDNLHRTLARLHRDLAQVFGGLRDQWRHEELAAYTFSPDLEYHRLDLALPLKRQTVKCRFLFVTFEGLGRKLAFTPTLPVLWFDVARGEALHDRATQVLTRHFREREKDDEDAAREPERLSLKGQAWVTTLEVEVPAPRAVREIEKSFFAFLGPEQVLGGAAELRRVGRCLDTQYPDELDRVLFREHEVAELARLLAADEHRPVLLVGPRQVGKTAVVHEYVYRQVEKRRSPYSSRANVWLLSPPRLISGMMYVGQWENRLLAILKEARKRKHVLYFEDFLGLYHAGISRDSSLSVAQVLKPYVERGEVRVLAEMTPEALRVFREQDRGFADLFHLLPVAEPSEEETLRILIAAARQFEGRQHCRFALDVLPTVLDLERRYVRGAAFPGKAAGFLRQLAVKCRQAEATRASALEEFHAQSGLSVSFLDTRVKLERQEVLNALAGQVIGQDAALGVAADVVAVAKARLNDPDRPLASLLFLGPTGVGKTQCAKALAAYLFGDADKLLRFDMNEFIAPTSVARLVGTFHEPEGLLTSAVRRQPFAVVLLDEIEKADPGVFDLLLQVLGEGRLTDALGRTADFSNTILILTSNLGVREAESRLGFRPADDDGRAFVQAAERFFRPEFFNRLDRVVPFRRLGRDDVGKIARLLIQGVFGREGLVRRKCALHVDGRALERVVDQGYDPMLGARALKRAIERQVAQPVAARLAGLTLETLTLISLFPAKDGIAVHVQPLEEAARSAPPADPEFREPTTVLSRVATAVARIEAQCAGLRPEGAVTLGRIQPEHYRYFAIREQADRVRDLCRQAADRRETGRAGVHAVPVYPQAALSRWRRKLVSLRFLDVPARRNFVAELAAAQDVHEYLKDLAHGAAGSAAEADAELAEIVRQTALLQAMAEAGVGTQADRALIYIRDLDETCPGTSHLLSTLYLAVFGEQLGLSAAEVPIDHEGPGSRLIVVTGAHALPLARVEEGTQLFCDARQSLGLLQVRVWPLAGDDPVAALSAEVNVRRLWLQALAEGTAVPDADPFRWQPVLRIHDSAGPTVDLRSGLLSPTLPDADTLRTFLLAALPLPPELLS